MDIGSNVLRALIDAEIVMDYADEYGEPSYSNTYVNGVIIGSFWCNKKYCDYEDVYPDGEKKLHGVEFHYPRLFQALKDQGFELQWHDEWIISNESSPTKAYRTQADSYHWQSSILWTDGDFLTPDDDIEDWVQEVVNDSDRCLPGHVWSDAELEEIGFKEYQCGFESGWHPGQTDDPKEITRMIREELGDEDKLDILFKLSHVSQFDLGFCVLVRNKGEDNNE